MRKNDQPVSEPFLPCASRLKEGDIIIGLGDAQHDLNLPAVVVEVGPSTPGWLIVHLQDAKTHQDTMTVLAMTQEVELLPPF